MQGALPLHFMETRDLWQIAGKVAPLSRLEETKALAKVQVVLEQAQIKGEEVWKKSQPYLHDAANIFDFSTSYISLFRNINKVMKAADIPQLASLTEGISAVINPIYEGLLPVVLVLSIVSLSLSIQKFSKGEMTGSQLAFEIAGFLRDLVGIGWITLHKFVESGLLPESFLQVVPGLSVSFLALSCIDVGKHVYKVVLVAQLKIKLDEIEDEAEIPTEIKANELFQSLYKAHEGDATLTVAELRERVNVELIKSSIKAGQSTMNLASALFITIAAFSFFPPATSILFTVGFSLKALSSLSSVALKSYDFSEACKRTSNSPIVDEPH